MCLSVGSVDTPHLSTGLDVRPALVVLIESLIQHKLVVASRCESRPGSCEEPR